MLAVKTTSWRFSVLLALLGISAAAALFVDAHRGIGEQLSYLKRHQELTFPELSHFFSALAKEQGALYAYDVLRRAELPPATDTHLLAHVVGDALYKERGVEGMEVCTDEFRNACSHSIVIGVLDGEGEGGLPRIAEACRKAPGGRGAYTMCFHGLGHGVFAYTGYDLEKTLLLCRTTGTEDHHQREYIECVGGSIMELAGGGGHDRAGWERAREKYLNREDPLSPCNLPFIPGEVQPICYIYLTPLLFAFESGEVKNPREREFNQAFLYCSRLREQENRDACFSGIGKELPTLVANRDIRVIGVLSPDQLQRVALWCALGKNMGGEEPCIRSVAQSLFWGGENDPQAALSFCSLVGNVQAVCLEELFEIARTYLSRKDQENFCNLPRFTDAYKKSCKEKVYL